MGVACSANKTKQYELALDELQTEIEAQRARWVRLKRKYDDGISNTATRLDEMRRSLRRKTVQTKQAESERDLLQEQIATIRSMVRKTQGAK